MSAKRALIVDDSRSARMILGRMLETHGMQVDTAESAEQGLEYLRSARPDVVFMDHLMPGMDGFDAVRAMKANEQTAEIPVLMYTSQEGEQYLRQARRAGAMGVLSKTLKPSDVSRALYDLHLLPDRRELSAPLPRLAQTLAASATALPSSSPNLSSSNLQVNAPRDAVPMPSIAPTADVPRSIAGGATGGVATGSERGIQKAVSTLLMEQHAELQAQVQANWEAMSNKLLDRVREQLRAVALGAGSSSAPDGPRNWFAVALTVIALVPTVVMAVLYWRTFNDHRLQLQESTARLAMVVTEQQTQIEQLRTELRKRIQGIPAVAPVEAPALVPYGEVPLAGARIERTRVLVDRLQRDGFRGAVVLTTYIGEFCLSGSSATGYSPAKDTLAARRCDLVGNPYEDSIAAQAPVQPPEFLQWQAAAVVATGGAIRVEARAGGRAPAMAYPAQSERLTAGEWNTVAARNNRVEFGLVPAAEDATVQPKSGPANGAQRVSPPIASPISPPISQPGSQATSQATSTAGSSGAAAKPLTE